VVALKLPLGITGAAPERLSGVFWVVNLALLILIGSLAGKLFTLALSPSAAIPVGAVDTGVISLERPRQSTLTPNDEARALFGQSGSTTELLPIRELSDTTLDLELIGIISHADPGKSLAMIATGPNNAGSFAVNHQIAGGVVLQDIQADRVVLSHQGRLEQLRLQRKALEAERLRSGAGARRAAPPPLGLEPGSQGLIAALAPRPVTLDDGSLGFSIHPDPDDASVQRIGLEPADIILQINGMELSDPEGLAEGLSLLESGDAIDIRLLRDGANMNLEIVVGDD